MKEFRFALKQTFPIMFTYLFIGIAFGVLMAENGYSALWSAVSSLFIYAGSMQIIMVPLLAAGAPLYTLAVTAFFVNARHIFYGLAFIERFRNMGWRYPYMVLSLTDETYSVLCSVREEGELNADRAAFLIAVTNHFYWVAGSFFGGWVGQSLSLDTTGIDFSATAFFITVVVSQFMQLRSKIPILVGAVSAVAFLLILGPDRFLIPALTVSLIVLLVMRDHIRVKGGEGDA